MQAMHSSQVIKKINATNQKALAAEMRELVSSIHLLRNEMTSMVFGRQCSSQDRHQLAELELIAVEVVNFGITLKNSYDIA